MVLISILVTQSSGMQLVNEDSLNSYLRMILEEFRKNPTDGKFLNIINPPLNGAMKSDFFMPKIFIWSPQEQFLGCTLRCPVHKCTLQPWKFTSEAGTKDRKPRLIFDLFGNVLLVQRIYLCKIRGHPHKIVASSYDLMFTLPRYIQNFFPITVFTRSGCTNQILDYINSNIVRGVNFAKIGEAIAELNLRHFSRRGLIYNGALEEGLVVGDPLDESDVYAEELYSFPSSDHIISIFLRDFETKRETYQNEMKKVTGSFISCDHTFKVSKNIGMVRPGNEDKFVTQFNNLYIVLNEEGKIVDWRLTKTTSFEEIREVLVQYKSRLEQANKKLELICVDDCCKVRNKYETVFDSTPVKLDLYHACQRVCKTVTHINHPLAGSFRKEFGLIFRYDNDQGEKRFRETPCARKILQNLNAFINRWSKLPNSPLSKETMGEIEKLKKHIDKGCLSGIPPGFGTERNEQLHRLLNRSMLTGATRISVELAVAILTVLFYYHSSRTSPAKHECNSKVGCAAPIEACIRNSTEDEISYTFPFAAASNILNTQDQVSDISPHTMSNDDNIIFVAENIEDVYTEFVSKVILDASNELFKVVTNLEKKNLNRGLQTLDLLALANMPDVLSDSSMFLQGDDVTVNGFVDVLNRNLAAFDLEIEEVIGDGDCAFRSLAKQIVKVSTGDIRFREHVESLGLLKSEDEDTYQLRQLFVDKLEDGDEELLAFLPLEGDSRNLHKQTNEFRLPGVFDKMLGDLIMKTCAQVLQTTIMMVTSNESVPWLLFVPDRFSSEQSLFVAFHFYGAGHYDSTKKLVEGNETSFW